MSSRCQAHGGARMAGIGFEGSIDLEMELISIMHELKKRDPASGGRETGGGGGMKLRASLPRGSESY